MFGQNSLDVFQYYMNGEIQGDCLIVSIRASGCSGTNWLADAVAWWKYSKIFTATEAAQDTIYQSGIVWGTPYPKFRFNLRSMQVSGTNSVLLNLQGWEETLVYKY